MSTGKADVTTDVMRRKLALLLGWGTKCYDVQPYRPYLAVTLIKHLRDIVLTRKASDTRWLEPYLFSWIDQAAESMDPETAFAMQVLSSELFNSALLKFDVYLERLIALGKTARHSSAANSVPRYLSFCRRLQIYDLSPVMTTLRKNITVGFADDSKVALHAHGIEKAFNQYLNQSNDIRYSSDLSQHTLADIPDILLRTDEPPLFDLCRGLIREFATTPISPHLDSIIRLSLFIHLLERQRSHRLLLDLVVTQWRVFGNSVSKPVADAIQRHRLLISALEEQHPDLCAAITPHDKAGMFASSVGSAVIVSKNDMVLHQIQNLQQQVSMIDYQTLEKLQSAHRLCQSADSISTMWTMSIEMIPRLDSQAKSEVISVIADLWTAITQSSRQAWRNHLRRWTLDVNSTSPVYVATSALSLELLLRGAIDWSSVWSKLVHPFVSSATQANLNRVYSQPMALLCVHLLSGDLESVGTAQDLLLHSAIASDLARLVAREGEAASVLRRLPSVFLILWDEASPSGVSKRVQSIVNSRCWRTLAMRYEADTKDAFFSAMKLVPERQAFLQSLLDVLLGRSGDCECCLHRGRRNRLTVFRTRLMSADVGTSMTSTDWRSLGISVIPEAGLSEATDVCLTLSQASSLVNAASELIRNGSISTWWRMCTTLPDHTLLMVSSTIILPKQQTLFNSVCSNR
jgi:hypothetical protein